MKRSLNDRGVYFSEQAVLDGRRRARDVQTRIDQVHAEGSNILHNVQSYVSVYKTEEGQFLPSTALRAQEGHDYHDIQKISLNGQRVGEITHEQIMALPDVSFESIASLCEEIGPDLAATTGADGQGLQIERSMGGSSLGSHKKDGLRR